MMERGVFWFVGISMLAILAASNRPATASKHVAGKREPAVVPVAIRFDPSYLQYAVLDTSSDAIVHAAVSNKATDYDSSSSRAESDVESKASASLRGNDRNFIQRIGNDGQSLEQAALYVASKTTNNDIRNYAARMGSERGKANLQLRELAAKRNIDIPSEPVGLLHAKLDRLRKMTGAQMERAFLEDFGVEGNRDALALFEVQANQTQDAELKDFASKQLPLLRERYNAGKTLLQNQKPMTKSVMVMLAAI